MKSILTFLIALVGVSSCNTGVDQSNNVNDKPSMTNDQSSIVNDLSSTSVAVVEFSSPVLSDADFVFSTCYGKKFIMADAKGAQLFGDHMQNELGIRLSDLGLGNAFVINKSGKKFLCTARHCAIGLEKYSENVGADIVLIDYDAMTQGYDKPLALTAAYEIEPSMTQADSIVIKGYLFNTQGVLQSVNVSGVGGVVDMNSYNEYISGENKVYLSKHSVVIKLATNVDLAGLSGSPAFNQNGKVVGVYSGRLVEEIAGDTTYYIRVELFN